jgi:hypothetical protein
MNSCTAFGFSPPAIRSEANVWRHSCNPIGRSPASHAGNARFLTVAGTNGSHAVRPSARSSPERPVASRCSFR